MPFISENFLLQGNTAAELFHTFAENEPILDYHCHLSVRDIAEGRQFRDLTEIWLEGDHYKWRAMRASGVPERYITGDASPRDKFLAWARTVPQTLRNPLYHWTHLELERYFGISELLNEKNALSVWDEANRQLATAEFTAQGILKKFGLCAVCTTDDPADSLQYHQRFHSSGFPVRVFPAFRPDRVLQTEDASAFNDWVARLGSAASLDITGFRELLDALRKRHDEFHEIGCRLSDHGLDTCPTEACSESEAEAIFKKLRAGHSLSTAQSTGWAGYLMLFFGQLDSEKGWTKQLHLGAYRNANTRAMSSVGRDSGYDSIADWPQVRSLVRFLDQLDQRGHLPKMILYNLNPADNYAFAAAVGNFQDGPVPGKIQFGSGWWFLDQKDGIEGQLNALSNCGLLSHFVGMTTDSRSFMSFPRHEYFRRVLCNLLGNEMDSGLLPGCKELVGGMVRNICFQNAKDYFALPSV
ncbi:MAG TPA: glucuronate isomerase [Terriglobales bacterium]|jgi:glucuronate isomerase|nr:glucuronate isomerase [Terriglobales bacterium]